MLRSTLLSAALLAAGAVAQTFTACNPLNSTCPPNPALGTTYEQKFDGSVKEFDPRFWNVTAGNDNLINFGASGANLVLHEKGQMVTIQSNFFIMWGQLEMVFRAAPGTGIISTVILISDDLDEIDWELMGGNHSFVENNYYGWGNVDQRNAQYDPVSVGPQDDYLNYTVDWNADRMQFLVDSKVVRTVNYDVPGKYPQTPMQVRFGIWAAGASDAPGTVEWAGGKTDFSQG
jgi:beta-glucanase (GH16 family)